LREFADYVEHPLFGVCWDTAHGNLSYKVRTEGQYQSIMDIGDKLKGLHISDNFGDGAHHHTWPFAGIINFDQVIQGLLDVNYDGFFNFEASYTLLHQKNLPYHRKAWEHNGETVTKLLNPSIALKQKAVDLLYETGKYMLETYGCFEE
jgi:sugar phosphate isomerase/epimerase